MAQKTDNGRSRSSRIPVAIEGATGEPVVFSVEEVERMAEMEHGRYNAERLLDGWRFGELKDDERKTSPHLVAWSELPDDVREYDRRTVRKIPEFLAEAKRTVRRKPQHKK